MKDHIENVHFSDDDKIKAFNEIEKLFYYANFGQASKSEIELLMFKIYLEKLIKENKDSNGQTIDYNKCSDYRISKELGITQQRVRNLKVKKQLVYPEEFHWEVALAKLMENARLEKPNSPESSKIIINIPDPNLFYEIQNFIEENGGYIETQLNSKILQIRQEYFLMIAVELEPEENQKKIIKRIKKELHSHNADDKAFDKAFDKKRVANSIIDGTVNVTTILANISSLFTVGAPLIEGLRTLIGA